MDYDFYYNAGWQCLEVRKGGDTDPWKQYVWDARYIDAPVVRYLDGNTDGDLLDENDDNTLYYMTDANMNVTGLIETDGTVLERYDYDPYGKAYFFDGSWNGVSGSQYSNRILYAGYRHDDESDLYLARFRYYHCTLGRWTSRDLIGYGGGASLYLYVHGMPGIMVDPYGLAVSGLSHQTANYFAQIYGQGNVKITEDSGGTYTIEFTNEEAAKKAAEDNKSGKSCSFVDLLTNFIASDKTYDISEVQRHHSAATSPPSRTLVRDRYGYRYVNDPEDYYAELAAGPPAPWAEAIDEVLPEVIVGGIAVAVVVVAAPAVPAVATAVPPAVVSVGRIVAAAVTAASLTPVGQFAVGFAEGFNAGFSSGPSPAGSGSPAQSAGQALGEAAGSALGG